MTTWNPTKDDWSTWLRGDAHASATRGLGADPLDEQVRAVLSRHPWQEVEATAVSPAPTESTISASAPPPEEDRTLARWGAAMEHETDVTQPAMPAVPTVEEPIEGLFIPMLTRAGVTTEGAAEPAGAMPSEPEPPTAGVERPEPAVEWPTAGVERPEPAVEWPTAGVERPTAGVERPEPAGVERPEPAGVERAVPAVERPAAGVERPELAGEGPGRAVEPPGVAVERLGAPVERPTLPDDGAPMDPWDESETDSGALQGVPWRERDLDPPGVPRSAPSLEGDEALPPGVPVEEGWGASLSGMMAISEAAAAWREEPGTPKAAEPPAADWSGPGLADWELPDEPEVEPVVPASLQVVVEEPIRPASAQTRGTVRAEPHDRSSAGEIVSAGESGSGAPQLEMLPAASRKIVVALGTTAPDAVEEEASEIDATDLVEEEEELEAAPVADEPASETRAALAALQAEREGMSAAELERRAARERSSEDAWYVEAFGVHYAALTRPDHLELSRAEAEFFVQASGLQAPARIADIGCGEGAQAVALAQAGFEVVGLDASLAQLARAQKLNESTGGGVRFVHGDMRRPPLEGRFDGVLCLGTTFGYFDEEENRAALRSMRELLRPQGRLLLQVLNRDAVVARLPARSWWQGQGCLVLDESEMNFFTNRVHVHRTIVFEDGRQYEHHIYVRAYSAHDLGHLCVENGLRVLEISGSRFTRARFYGATSPEIWLLLERQD